MSFGFSTTKQVTLKDFKKDFSNFYFKNISEGLYIVSYLEKNVLLYVDNGIISTFEVKNNMDGMDIVNEFSRFYSDPLITDEEIREKLH